jgi:hypothetical protein
VSGADTVTSIITGPRCRRRERLRTWWAISASVASGAKLRETTESAKITLRRLSLARADLTYCRKPTGMARLPESTLHGEIRFIIGIPFAFEVCKFVDVSRRQLWGGIVVARSEVWGSHQLFPHTFVICFFPTSVSLRSIRGLARIRDNRFVTKFGTWAGRGCVPR